MDAIRDLGAVSDKNYNISKYSERISSFESEPKSSVVGYECEGSALWLIFAHRPLQGGLL